MEKRNTHSLLVGMHSGTATMEHSTAVPQKLRIELLYDPSISSSEYLPENSETFIHKNTRTVCLFQHHSWWTRHGNNQSVLLIDDRINKMWCIYTKEYYSAIREDEITAFAITWMDLENMMLSKISQSGKAKNHVISLIGGI